MGDLSGSVSVAGTDVGNAVVVLSAMAASVTNQPKFPDVTADELRDLNPHLAAAQGHANQWINSWSAQVWDRLQGIVTFGEEFGNLEDALRKAAGAIGDETSFAPDQIAQLVAMLQALQTQVSGQQTQSEAVFDAITQYATEVGSDYSTFLTDFNTANRVLGGDSGAIQRLTEKIAAEHDAMSKDLAMIGGGAAMMVVGILIIAVGALAEFETAGAATLVIGAGIAVVAGGAAMTGVAGKDYDDKLGQIAQDEAELATDQAEIALLHGVGTQLTALTTTLGKAQAALGNLVTAWEQLDNGIQAVVDDLQNPEDYLASIRVTQPHATPATVSLIISAEIETAAQDWSNAVSLATAYLAKGRNIQYVDTGSSPPTQANIVAAAAAAGHAAALPRVRRLAAVAG